MGDELHRRIAEVRAERENRTPTEQRVLDLEAEVRRLKQDNSARVDYMEGIGHEHLFQRWRNGGGEWA